MLVEAGEQGQANRKLVSDYKSRPTHLPEQYRSLEKLNKEYWWWGGKRSQSTPHTEPALETRQAQRALFRQLDAVLQMRSMKLGIGVPFQEQQRQAWN